jgi:hypothetical protein
MSRPKTTWLMVSIHMPTMALHLLPSQAMPLHDRLARLHYSIPIPVAAIALQATSHFYLPFTKVAAPLRRHYRQSRQPHRQEIQGDFLKLAKVHLLMVLPTFCPYLKVQRPQFIRRAPETTDWIRPFVND